MRNWLQCLIEAMARDALQTLRNRASLTAGRISLRPVRKDLHRSSTRGGVLPDAAALIQVRSIKAPPAAPAK
jgi:hypothetical protein